MQPVKISIKCYPDDPSPDETAGLIARYVDEHVVKSSVIEDVTKVSRGVVIECVDFDSAETTLLSILSDYASFGHALPEDLQLDIEAVYVFCDEPELQAMFQQQRVSFTICSLDSLFDMQNKDSADVRRTKKLVGVIDATHTMNGTYHFREIMEMFATKLIEKEIITADDVTDIFETTIH